MINGAGATNLRVHSRATNRFLRDDTHRAAGFALKLSTTLIFPNG